MSKPVGGVWNCILKPGWSREGRFLLGQRTRRQAATRKLGGPRCSRRRGGQGPRGCSTRSQQGLSVDNRELGRQTVVGTDPARACSRVPPVDMYARGSPVASPGSQQGRDRSRTHEPPATKEPRARRRRRQGPARPPRAPLPSSSSTRARRYERTVADCRVRRTASLQHRTDGGQEERPAHARQIAGYVSPKTTNSPGMLANQQPPSAGEHRSGWRTASERQHDATQQTRERRAPPTMPRPALQSRGPPLTTFAPSRHVAPPGIPAGTSGAAPAGRSRQR